MKATKRTYSPAVLLVDDDISVRRMIRQKFHKETSIGVIVSRDLSEARTIIDDDKIEFDAIISDIVFESGTNDPKYDLYDGIDLLGYSKKKRPKLSEYVISCWADTKPYHERAEQNGSQIEDWFQKLAFGLSQDVKAPWITIERDLIKKALQNDVTFQERAKSLGLQSNADEDIEALAERARDSLCPTIHTYIQELEDDNFTVVHPIEVYCRQININQAVASALKLGLLQEGEGENIEDALENLKEIIVDQIEFFENEDKGNIVGFAKLAMERLNYYVEKKSKQ